MDSLEEFKEILRQNSVLPGDHIRSEGGASPDNPSMPLLEIPCGINSVEDAIGYILPIVSLVMASHGAKVTFAVGENLVGLINKYPQDFTIKLVILAHLSVLYYEPNVRDGLHTLTFFRM